MAQLGSATGWTQVCPTRIGIADEEPGGASDVEEVEERQGLRALTQRMAASEENGAPIQGLPDDVMTLIFARLPRRSLLAARRVCASWKRVCEHRDLAALRCQMGVAEGWIYVLAETREESPFRAYDPDADAWTFLPPMPGRRGCSRWQGFACVALGHKLLLIGGTRTHGSPDSDRYSSGAVCGDVVVYDALTNKWSSGTSMLTPRSWFAAAAVGAKVYVAGGQGAATFLNSAEVYDLEADTWAPIASMGNQRSSCRGVALDGHFWVVAGEYVKNHYDDNQRSSAEVYDAEADAWRFVPDMCPDNNKVLGPSAVVDGELVCVHRRRVMGYDKRLNAWTYLGHIIGGEAPQCQFGFACESVGRNLYVVGGIREYMLHHSTQLDTVAICNLRGSQKVAPLRWTLGANMRPGGGIMSASAVLWL